jgi:hypothetical protein
VPDSDYEVRRGGFRGDAHRAYVGGKWEELGALQLSFLCSRGLEPQHRLIDVGCGALRGGRHFIDYLQPFRYYGTDINAALIEAGLARELTAAQREKIGDGHFRVSEDFDVDFPVPAFDFGLALSLFTHLSSNRIRLCLQRLRPKFHGGRFYGSFFLSESRDWAAPVEQAPGLVSYSWKDPFHYRREEIEALAAACDWRVTWAGAFGHPKNQQMVEFAAPV